ncbi:anthocyanin 5-aromatic acyltransferase-like [Salvia hispanica]|uniref:anthocyanin 5-aromatic acyltransferase-like n=1 Tax=Salvia hispanica TaxID=49212 RepID=UPI002009CB66|nr:anthocyanin 5-aromatic acyltransferase-like [Salvia hispanica]
MATLLESFKISPRPGGSPESVPLVFFDMLWYGFAANQSVLFFDFPCSKPHFLDTIVPQLKQSLSLTLTYFLPLAGNIIHPLTPAEKPVLRYQAADSVSLTVSESDADFRYLTGNQQRNCDEFYEFVPLLPRAVASEAAISCPVLALQVTLFPGKGLAIGIVTHHAIADASTVVSFMQAWGLINRIGLDAENIQADLAESNLLPSFARELATDLNGLDSLYWDLIIKECCAVEPPPPVALPTNKVRATLVVKMDEIKALKEFVLARGVAHVSSFTVVCALFWACAARASDDDVAEDEVECFGFTVDCRGRLKPPLPANYFGNCVVLARAELRHGEVKGAEGFVAAARAIGAAVKESANREKGVLDGAEDWPAEYAGLIGKRQFGVAGSPRFDFYAVDFGWGKPEKFEPLFIDGGNSISLCKSRYFEGGVEIGFSKPKLEMESFAKVFSEILNDLLG